MKYLQTLLLVTAVTVVTSILPTHIQADAKTAASSAAFTVSTLPKQRDNRVAILKAYLTKKDSPLAGSAKTFVDEADKYNLDWKFVVAIAGLESSFGKAIPPSSYNGWGWGVYGDNVHYFTSWDDAIHTISQGLRTQYMDKWGATDVYSIGHIYAASPTWAQRVTFFMNDIEKYQDNWSDTSLSLSF